MIVNGAPVVRERRPKREQTLEERVVAYYKKRDKNPMVMARLFRDLQEKYEGGVTAAVESLGLPAGSYSNYIGLLRLPDDMKAAVQKRRLPYKSARALSRIPHAQSKPIWVFAKREALVSGDIERMCNLAKQHPSMTPQQLWDMSKGRPVKGKAAPARVVNYVRKPVEKMAQVTPSDLVQVAGYVEGLKPTSDVEKLPLLSTLRALQKRVDDKIRELSS